MYVSQILSVFWWTIRLGFSTYPFLLILQDVLYLQLVYYGDTRIIVLSKRLDCRLFRNVVSELLDIHSFLVKLLSLRDSESSLQMLNSNTDAKKLNMSLRAKLTTELKAILWNIDDTVISRIFIHRKRNLRQMIPVPLRIMVQKEIINNFREPIS